MIVEDNVVSLMLYLKCAPSDCTREEALDAFDLLVRRTMPCRIRASTGRTLLQYESFMTMIFPIMLSVFDVACAHLVAGDSARQLIGATIEVGTRTLAGLPLSFALSMWICGLCQNLRGMRDILYILFVDSVTLLSNFQLYVLLRLLQTNAIEGEMYFAVLCAVAAGLFTLTYLVFRRSPGKVHRRRIGDSHRVRGGNRRGASQDDWCLSRVFVLKWCAEAQDG